MQLSNLINHFLPLLLVGVFSTFVGTLLREASDADNFLLLMSGTEITNNLWKKG